MSSLSITIPFKNIILLFAGVLCLSGFSDPINDPSIPDRFTAKFETTQGSFKIEAKKKWAPIGYERLYELIQSGFYTDVAIHRVIPGTVAQFGIHTKRSINAEWNSQIIQDDPVTRPNYKWAISFASAGENSRGTELFINLRNNYDFDESGFAVVAKVTSGMNVIESFYSAYGNDISKDLNAIFQAGNLFLRARYPNLDYIEKAYIVEEK